MVYVAGPQQLGGKKIHQVRRAWGEVGGMGVGGARWGPAVMEGRKELEGGLIPLGMDQTLALGASGCVPGALSPPPPPQAPRTPAGGACPQAKHEGLKKLIWGGSF